MIYDLFKYLQIMITHWDIFVEFRFYNMGFNRGTLLKGEFGPSSRPCPFFDVLLFCLPMPILLPRIRSHVLIKEEVVHTFQNEGLLFLPEMPVELCFNS